MRTSTLSVMLAVALLGWGLPDSAHAQRRSQPAPVDMPEGAGRALVEASCGECHGLNRITNYWGDTESGWRQLFDSMVDLPGDDAETVAAYLAGHFRLNRPPKRSSYLETAVSQSTSGCCPASGPDRTTHLRRTMGRSGGLDSGRRCWAGSSRRPGS